MSFFDKKQDVIDIQLTRYGKRLLSEGIFRPVYYEFYDDDVLYNPDSAGIRETQSRSEERIFESQRLKMPAHRKGAETALYEEDVTDELPNSDHNRNKSVLRCPIGEHAANSLEAPHFTLYSYDAPFIPSTFSNTIEIDGLVTQIPQIEIDCKYELKLNREKALNLNDPIILDSIKDGDFYFDLSSDHIKFLDNSHLKTVSSDIVISLKEENSSFSLEDYELEIFEIIEPTGEGQDSFLKKIKKESEVSRYFNITKDKSVSLTQRETGEY